MIDTHLEASLRVLPVPILYLQGGLGVSSARAFASCHMEIVYDQHGALDSNDRGEQNVRKMNTAVGVSRESGKEVRVSYSTT